MPNDKKDIESDDETDIDVGIESSDDELENKSGYYPKKNLNINTEDQFTRQGSTRKKIPLNLQHTNNDNNINIIRNNININNISGNNITNFNNNSSNINTENMKIKHSKKKLGEFSIIDENKIKDEIVKYMNSYDFKENYKKDFPHRTVTYDEKINEDNLKLKEYEEEKEKNPDAFINPEYIKNEMETDRKIIEKLSNQKEVKPTEKHYRQRINTAVSARLANKSNIKNVDSKGRENTNINFKNKENTNIYPVTSKQAEMIRNFHTSIDLDDLNEIFHDVIEQRGAELDKQLFKVGNEAKKLDPAMETHQQENIVGKKREGNKFSVLPKKRK